MNRTLAFVVIAAFFGTGFGFLLAVSTGASLVAHDHATHDHGAHGGGGGDHAHERVIEVPDGPDAPGLDFILHEEDGGWSLHVLTENFRFAPEHVNGPHVPGEGHAHIYADGRKLARIYGPWFHIPRLPEGAGTLTVTLNGNDHGVLSVGGERLAVSCDLPGCETVRAGDWD